MKSFVFAMITFILIFVGIGYYTHILSDEMHHMEQRLSDVVDCVEKEDWDDCIKKTDTLMSDWNKTQRWLKAIINHKEMDTILQTLYEMKGYIDIQNKEEALVKAGVLEMFFKHIPENEALSIMNIL